MAKHKPDPKDHLRPQREEKREKRNLALPAFLLTMVLMVVGWRVYEIYWVAQETSYPDTQTLKSATIDAKNIDRLIRDWPNAYLAGKEALDAAGVSADDPGAEALRQRAQEAWFVRNGWEPGAGPRLFAYMMTLRYALDKDGVEYRRLIYFRDHFERNDDLVTDVSQSVLRQVEKVIAAMDAAPDVNTLPPGDVALMRYYYDDFHKMLKAAGRAVELAPPTAE